MGERSTSQTDVSHCFNLRALDPAGQSSRLQARQSGDRLSPGSPLIQTPEVILIRNFRVEDSIFPCKLPFKAIPAVAGMAK